MTYIWILLTRSCQHFESTEKESSIEACCLSSVDYRIDIDSGMKLVSTVNIIYYEVIK